MSTSPVSTFTGVSSYASDLQTALTRAISIASLPIQQLSTIKSKFDSQASELGQLGNLFSNLQTAIQTLASSNANGALSAQSSNTSAVQASLSGSALQGSYVVQVLNAGSFASALSNAGTPAITDPSSQSISASTSFTLTVGTNTYNINPTGQNLNALAAAINSSGAPVQATIINLGSPSAADYRLALQSTSLGNVALQLNDGSSNLLNGVAPGSSASYTVNGQPPGGITTNSQTVTIAPGLTANLQAVGTATITVASNTGGISNALSSFVTAFNSVEAELAKNRGQAGGPLTGDSILMSLQDNLNQIVNYSGSSGSLTSLTQLGVEFTQQGTLTFDPSKLAGLSQDQISQLETFLGDPSSSGFLQFATNAMTSVLDPTTGILPSDLSAVESESQQEAQAISDAQNRVNQMAINLQAQLSAADALIATLQQQTQFIAGLFNIPKLNANGTTSTNGNNG